MAQILKFILLLVLVNLVTTDLISQTSPRIKTQSNLKDANGKAVPDGTYPMTFNLYHTESFGTSLWSENANVIVKGGIYNHLLGSVVTLDNVDFTKKVFLGITIGVHELAPRTELTYAPYAVASYNVVCSGAVGDVKYSILDPTLFAQVNGDCWIPLNGESMVNSRLANIIGTSNVPDIGGLFVRSQEFSNGANHDSDRTSSSPIASFQDQSYQSHNHGINDPGHVHTVNDKVRAYSAWGDDYGVIGNQPRLVHLDQYDSESRLIDISVTGVTVNNSGGVETRPKNLNVWMYIRIN